jgi:hypothetical protein
VRRARCKTLSIVLADDPSVNTLGVIHRGNASAARPRRFTAAARARSDSPSSSLGAYGCMGAGRTGGCHPNKAKVIGCGM